MISRGIIILWTCFCVWGFFEGQIAVQRLVETRTIAPGLADFAAGFGFVAWMITWSFVVVPVALVGLLFSPKQPVQHIVMHDASPTIGRKEPLLLQREEGRVPCPYCAERVRPEAVVCPHCRRELQSLLDLRQ